MIDGVMIRLLVTVWKLTVAIAWQTATTAIATSELLRICATSQNPSLPTGIGLSTARWANPMPTASMSRPTNTTR